MKDDIKRTIEMKAEIQRQIEFATKNGIALTWRSNNSQESVKVSKNGYTKRLYNVSFWVGPNLLTAVDDSNLTEAVDAVHDWIKNGCSFPY